MNINPSIRKLLLEEKLILMCLISNSEFSNQWIRDALTQHRIDWDYIIRLTQFHGIFPFVFDSVNKLGCPGIHKVVRAQLWTLWQEHMARNVVLHSEFDRLMGQFNKEEIEVIPLKGFSWAKQFYPNENLRSFNDLDFLVKPKDLDAAKRILKSQNYEPRPYIDSDNCPENSWNIRFYKTLPRRKRVCVELHWGLARPRDYRIPLKKWWCNVRKIQAKGQSIRSFSLEDIVLYITIDIHSSKYLYLKQFIDLRQIIIQNNDVLDIGYIERSAKSMGVWSNFCFAVYMMEQLFGDEQLHQIKVDRLEKSRKIYMIKRLLGKQDIIKGRYSEDVRQFFLLLLLNDRVGHILKAGVRTLFPSFKATVYRYYLKPESKMAYFLYIMNPFLSFFRLFRGEKGIQEVN